MAMTKTEKHKLARAIFEVAHLPGADLNTCVAVAQAIVKEFDAHDGFSHFVLSATGIQDGRDYIAKLRGDVNGSAH